LTPIDNAGKYKVDLQMHAFNDLQDIGFEKINISISTDCTYCEVEKYHSYRRDGEISGRMIGLIGSGKLD
jgi:copper oxidase (laccase) domain-containing protein